MFFFENSFKEINVQKKAVQLFIAPLKKQNYF